MKVTVGLGDFLASFSPAGFQRFTQAHSYDVTFTGAEANVLVSLSRLGLNTPQGIVLVYLGFGAGLVCIVRVQRKYNQGVF